MSTRVIDASACKSTHAVLKLILDFGQGHSEDALVEWLRRRYAQPGQPFIHVVNIELTQRTAGLTDALDRANVPRMISWRVDRTKAKKIGQTRKVVQSLLKPGETLTTAKLRDRCVRDGHPIHLSVIRRALISMEKEGLVERHIKYGGVGGTVSTVTIR